jgi:hypothetical protein
MLVKTKTKKNKYLKGQALEKVCGEIMIWDIRFGLN